MQFNLHERAGIKCLGPYRSKGKEGKLADALHSLSRAVEVPAVDHPLYAAVVQLGHRLNVAEENRSVTSEQWVEKAIWKYGCPIHATRDGSPARRRLPRCTCIRETQREVRNGVSTEHQTTGGVFGSTGEGDSPEYVRPGSSDDSHRHNHGRTSISGGNTDVRAHRDRGSEQELAHRLAIQSVYSSAGHLERRAKPLEHAEVVANHIHGSSFSGLPLLSSNSLVLDAGARLAERIASGRRGFDPYLFGRRVQPGPAGPKTRLVWMASLPTTIIGLAFSKPVQESLARNRPYTWGLKHYEEGALIAEMSGRYRYVYSIDWSSFDANIDPSLINNMFRVVRSMLDLSESENDLFWRYVNDFIHTRIVLPDGNVWQVHRGVPSGSAFTSLIDSMANVYAMNYLWCRLTGHVLSHNQLLVMGDDAVFGSDERVELDDLASIAEELGFTLNVVKSLVISSSAVDEKGVHFIGHYWSNGRARRPHRELYLRMALPERHSKPDKHRSLLRLGGYALSSVDGLIILMQIYDQHDLVSAVCQYLYDLRTDEDDGGALRAQDLPGDLRRRVLVEGEQMPILGHGSGPHALLFGSVF